MDALCSLCLLHAGVSVYLVRKSVISFRNPKYTFFFQPFPSFICSMCPEGSMEEAQNSREKHLYNFARKMVPRNWTQQNPQFSNTLEINLCSLLHIHLDRSSFISPFRGFPWAVCCRKWVISPLRHTAGKKPKGQQQWDLLSRNQVGLPRVSQRIMVSDMYLLQTCNLDQ